MEFETIMVLSSFSGNDRINFFLDTLHTYIIMEIHNRHGLIQKITENQINKNKANEYFLFLKDNFNNRLSRTNG